ncbi:sigma-54 dependent transcriptional regulator [Salipaludibacillus sp. CUR1]|uniref:sigma-54-dependent transcriptional regulator n=1 Tax=Salipaludibacillus sp. CUR1 TaxID=2820003 RepID=UPI001E333E68|nr:sigma-54 dependent transcriptional regulator [Salipaludibacillus sp. CUR1]MCE7790825.1 sigma-54 dependent transcriptional regulator [Salipaludibacillus sp. CUR1]
MTRVIIVDDEEDLRGLLVKRLKRRGYEAAGFPSAEAALDNLKKESYDLGIFDIRMDGMDGLTLLEKVKESESKAMEVIVLTGHGTIETAIEAMKKGAYDYLTKPYNLAELEVVLGKALEKKQLKEDHHSMKEWMHFRENTFDIIGESEKIRQVKELTAKVANADASILIEGESGTGKELFAKALHYWSERRDEPFITVNSGAIPEQLLESELFGHAKGAFTGAQKEKKGLVEVADKGTLFLDEIGEMPLDTQVKLLRFLETGEFRRVGEVRERRVNVRVVTATNRNMEEEVAKGNFREDLFYRLQVLKIVVPPLRERKDDIPELVQFYLASKKEWKEKSLSDEALKALMRYDYPGNVRELFHIIERGCLLCSGNTITSGDLLLPGGEDRLSKTPVASGHVERSLEEVEREHIAAVLDYTNWNKSDAAHILGVSVRNIYRKIDQYELEKD